MPSSTFRARLRSLRERAVGLANTSRAPWLEQSHSSCIPVAAGTEPGGRVVWGDGFEGLGDGLVQGFGSTCLGRAQELFELSTTVVDRMRAEAIRAFDSGSTWPGIGVVFATGTNAAGVQCRATRATAFR